MAKETPRSIFFKGIIVVMILGVLVRQYIKYRVAPELKTTDLELVDIDGQIIDLKQFEGKTIFINFFATWCGPCHAEMPDLENMRRQLGNEDFVFIAISDESPQLIQNFKNKHQSGFLFAQSKKNREELGVHTIPTSYIVDKNGNVTYKNIGVEDWDSAEMLKTIRQLGSGN